MNWKILSIGLILVLIAVMGVGYYQLQELNEKVVSLSDNVTTCEKEIAALKGVEAGKVEEIEKFKKEMGIFKKTMGEKMAELQGQVVNMGKFVSGKDKTTVVAVENLKKDIAILRAMVADDLAYPILLSPAPGARDLPVNVCWTIGFDWTSVKDAKEYRFQLALDPVMTKLLSDKMVATTAYKSEARTMTLDYATPYFWRVGVAGKDGRIVWSDVAVFSTEYLPLPPY